MQSGPIFDKLLYQVPKSGVEHEIREERMRTRENVSAAMSDEATNVI